MKNMQVIIFQLITIGAIFLCVVYEVCAMSTAKDEDENNVEKVWTMLAEGTGAAKRGFGQELMRGKALRRSLSIGEGSYIISNRFFNDIYVNSSGSLVKLYLNVQREKLYITILKGEISINNCMCYADPTNRIEIPEYSTLRIADVGIQFCRKRVK